MTDYLTLTEFVPGTKAKAEEVNANFSALKDAVNTKALLSGDSSNTFNVAAGIEDSNAVNKQQLDAFAEQTIDATKFCCNKGLTTDGTPSLLSYYNNAVTLNASSVNAIITDHLGVSTTLTKDVTLDVAGITNIIYIYFKTDDGTMFKTTNKHVFAYSRPSNPTEDTIYIYPNNNVWVAEYYKNSAYQTLTGCAYLGDFTPASEILTTANWTTTGWSGAFSNGFTHIAGNINALSNCQIANSGTKYQVTYTVTNRTAGSFTISFGGSTSDTLTESGYFNVTASSASNLVITPTTDFNGTIVLSLKVLALETNLYNQNGYIVNNETVVESHTKLASSIKTYCTPNYQNIIAKCWETLYKAETDGYVYTCIDAYASNTGYLIINSLYFKIGVFGPGNNCYYSLCMPVAKGDTYKASGGVDWPQITFIPMKGE